MNFGALNEYNELRQNGAGATQEVANLIKFTG